jgi:hypothetical protein
VERGPRTAAHAHFATEKVNAGFARDGTAAFTQVLPKIVGGFTIGLGTGAVPLYSGGQEIVVAEVVGGQHLEVGPSAGDTIDGSTNLVRIRAHGSRTFVSEGYTNWITTSVVS